MIRPVRGSTSVSSVSASPIPITMPPRSWLAASLRVDHPADVEHPDPARHPHLAGVRVHPDLAELGAGGRLHPAPPVAQDLGHEPGLPGQRAEPVSAPVRTVSSARPARRRIAPSSAPPAGPYSRPRAADRRPPRAVQRRVGRLARQPVQGDAQLLDRTQQAGGDARGLRGPAGHRPGRQVGVAVLHAHRVHRHAERVARRSGPAAVAVPMPISWNAQRTRTRAVGVEPQRHVGRHLHRRVERRGHSPADQPRAVPHRAGLPVAVGPAEPLGPAAQRLAPGRGGRTAVADRSGRARARCAAAARPGRCPARAASSSMLDSSANVPMDSPGARMKVFGSRSSGTVLGSIVMFSAA